jgi:hypothetical protein
MRKFQSLFVVAALLIVGCTTDPYRAAIQGSSDVSQAVSSAIKITASYYSTGVFSDGQKATAATIFTVVTDCNMTFRKAVVGVHNAGQTSVAAFLPIADAFVACTERAPQIQNDAKLKNTLQAVDAAIQGVRLAISNAKGAKP